MIIDRTSTTSPDSRTRKSYPSSCLLPLVEQYYSETERLVECLESKDPRNLIALSRSGIALMEILACAFPKVIKRLISGLTEGLLSERALPFLGDLEGKTVTLDDLLLYGSTWSEVNLDVQRMLNGESTVESVALAVGPQANFNLVNPNRFLVLAESQVSTYCNSLAQSISQLGRPYDIGHPFFVFPVNPLSEITLKDIRRALRKLPYPVLDRESTDGTCLSACYLDSRWSCAQFNEHLRMRPGGPSRIHFFFDPRESLWGFCPVAPIHIQHTVSEVADTRFDHRLSAAIHHDFGAFVEAGLQAVAQSNLSKEKIGLAKLQLLTFVSEYRLGCQFLLALDQIRSFPLISVRPHLDLRSATYLFGQTLAQRLVALHQEHISGLHDRDGDEQQHIETRTTSDCDDAIETRVVNTEMYSLLKNSVTSRPIRASGPLRIASHILSNMQQKVDEENRPQGKVNQPGRLRRGMMEYEWIELLSDLSGKGAERIIPQDWAVAFDSLDRQGAMVPIPAVCEDGTIADVKRFGENADVGRYFHAVVASVMKAISDGEARKGVTTRTKNHLPHILTEKIFAALVDFLRERALWIQRNQMNVVRSYYKFGARMTIVENNERHSLYHWCVANGIFEDSEEPNEAAGGHSEKQKETRFIFRPECLEDYADIEAAQLKSSIIAPAKNLVSLFYFLVGASKKEFSPTETLLLLTTCRTAAETRKATLTCLELWLGLDHASSFYEKSHRAFLNKTEFLRKKSAHKEGDIVLEAPLSDKDLDSLRRGSRELTEYLNQVSLKLQTFQKVSAFLEWVRKLIDQNPAYEGMWDEFYYQVHKPDASVEAQAEFDRITFFKELLSNLTQSARHFIEDSTIFRMSSIPRDATLSTPPAHDAHVYLSAYNALVLEEQRRQRFPVFPQVSEKLILMLRSKQPSMTVIAKAYRDELLKIDLQLRSIFQAVWPKPREEVLHPITRELLEGYVVMYDLKASTDEPRDENNTARLRTLNERFRAFCDVLHDPHFNRFFRPTTNDTNQFVFASIQNCVTAVLELLRIAEEEGFRLRISIVCLDREHPVHFVHDDPELAASQIYPIAKRLQDCATQPLVPANFSVNEIVSEHSVYADEKTAQSVRNDLGANTALTPIFLTKIDPKGESLPSRVAVFECVRVEDGVQRPARLLVMLSGSGTTLQNLIDKQGRAFNGEIVRVISNKPGVYGLDRAKTAGIPTLVLSPKAFDNEHHYKLELWEHWKQAEIDFVILAGYLKKVPVDEFWAGKVINIHPALLPKFGGQGMYGIHVHRAVIQGREKETGCTVHFVDGEYDRGPIIEQSRVAVVNEDTEFTLEKKVQAAERELFPKVVADLISGRVVLKNGRAEKSSL
jgi:phosphoribosylglycinamide formyltransferase 1